MNLTPAVLVRAAAGSTVSIPTAADPLDTKCPLPRRTRDTVHNDVNHVGEDLSTEPKLWTLSTLKSARANAAGEFEVDPANPVVFTIPHFQRSLVWPEAKQRDLVASILKGFPLGALLLVEYPAKKQIQLPNGRTVDASNYGIIDGLQRTNAIVSHLRASLAFATEEAVSGPAFDGLHAALEREMGTRLDATAVMDAVVEWMVETREPDVTKGFDFDTLLTSLTRSLGVPLSAAQQSALKPRANALLSHIAGRVDISHLQIPVLVYKGPSAHLPDIFEKINTAGTMLSKYEVYAAAWVSTEVEVANTKVRSAIARRYKRLESEGFDVETVGGSNIYSLFDYLHGLSQVLGETYPLLFSKKDAVENKLSGGFPLATLMLGHALDKMADLHDLFPEHPTIPNRLLVDAFETALFEAAQFVNDVLSPFLAFKFESDGDNPAHGELQIVSMVAAVAVNLRDPNDSFKPRGTKPARKALEKKFKTALPQHYIYDIVRQFWRGSLYTYATERVWSGANPSKSYSVNVDPSSFESALNTLYSEQMASPSHRRSNIKTYQRVFLKFVYSRKVSVQDQAANKFDVEHWLPVKRLQDLTARKEPWAMGIMGNLGVLPRTTNRIKKEETISEYLARTSKRPTPTEVALIKKMMFVPAHSIAFQKDPTGNDKMSQAQYNALVRRNWDAMCRDLKNNIGL